MPVAHAQCRQPASSLEPTASAARIRLLGQGPVLAAFLLLFATGKFAAGAGGAEAEAAAPQEAETPPPRPNEAASLVEAGAKALEKGVDGDEESVLEAIERFEEAIERDPDNARARAHLGMALVVRARDASIFKKWGAVNRGLREAEQAVDMAPQDPSVRLIRALLSYKVPGFFGRRDVARQDFEFLLGQVDRDNNGELPETLKRRIYYHAGSFALEEAEPSAAALLAKAKTFNGDKPSSEKIESKLEVARRQLIQDG